MLQRNDSGSPLIIPHIPAEVPPGGEIDFPELLAGFTPVAEPKTAVRPKPSKAPAPSDTEEASE